jgi:uncharacterized protein VirK/YbjX
VKRRVPSGAATAPETVPVLRLITSAAQKIHGGSSPTALKRRAFFICRALRYRPLLQQFWARLINASRDGRLPVTAEVLGVTEWPYLNNAWGVAERLDRIATHYELLASTSNTLLGLDRRTAVRLLDLSRFSTHCEIIIDRPLWFKREGELVLNLFRETIRVASLAFILGTQNGAPAIFIGAIQGVNRAVSSEESLEIFRDLTKDFEGVRPRSLLLDILRMIAAELQVKTLLAVADENRHHRHKYFGAGEQSKLAANYNEIWSEHGGSPSAVPTFYELPVQQPRKELADVPTKKRAMYRRRYAMLAEIEAEVSNTIRESIAASSAANPTRPLGA